MDSQFNDTNTTGDELRYGGKSLDTSRDDLEDAFLRVVSSPSVVSKSWVSKWRSAASARSLTFTKNGNIVVLVGETDDDLSGSVYLYTRFSDDSTDLPKVDPEKDRAIKACVRRMKDKNLLEGVHPISEGGIAVALAECAVAAGKGVQVSLADDFAPAASLFAENPSRVIVTLDATNVEEVADLLDESYIPYMALGAVGGNRVRFDDEYGHTLVDLPLEQIVGIYSHADDDLGK